MKVMIVSDTYAPDVNGAARFTERLGAGMVARGHEVHQIAPSIGYRDYVELFDGIVVHRLRSVPWPFFTSFRFVLPWDVTPRLRKIIDDVKPDVIHLQNHFMIGRFAIGLARRRGIPVVATNHFMPENLLEHARIPQVISDGVSKVAWADLRSIYGRASALTAPTPRAVELLETSAHLTGGEAISCGIDTAVYKAAADAAAPNPVPVILFVGRLDQEKRVNELIRAAAKLPDDLDFRLEIIGDGAHRADWTQLAAEVGLGDRVNFRGFVDEDELVEAYGRTDIFCIPGIAELQSLVTLEAMSAGKPIVAADAMALPHLVHPEQNGYLYQPGDVDELTGYLETLLRDPDKREAFGKRSQQIVAPHAIGGTLDRFEAIYDEVTKDRRR